LLGTLFAYESEEVTGCGELCKEDSQNLNFLTNLYNDQRNEKGWTRSTSGDKRTNLPSENQKERGYLEDAE
jgi:hypothetical protein